MVTLSSGVCRQNLWVAGLKKVHCPNYLEQRAEKGQGSAVKKGWGAASPHRVVLLFPCSSSQFKTKQLMQGTGQGEGTTPPMWNFLWSLHPLQNWKHNVLNALTGKNRKIVFTLRGQANRVFFHPISLACLGVVHPSKNAHSRYLNVMAARTQLLKEICLSDSALSHMPDLIVWILRITNSSSPSELRILMKLETNGHFSQLHFARGLRAWKRHQVLSIFHTCFFYKAKAEQWLHCHCLAS